MLTLLPRPASLKLTVRVPLLLGPAAEPLMKCGLAAAAGPTASSRVPATIANKLGSRRMTLLLPARGGGSTEATALPTPPGPIGAKHTARAQDEPLTAGC